MPYNGSCHCGAVKYEIERLDTLGHCHCVTCRKTHSAAYNTAGRVRRENFRWLAGEDRLKAYESSPGKERFFCGNCGCHLMAAHRDADYVILRAASLDDDPGLRPQRHIWRSHEAAWLQDEGNVPSYPEWPPGP